MSSRIWWRSRSRLALLLVGVACLGILAWRGPLLWNLISQTQFPRLSPVSGVVQLYVQDRWTADPILRREWSLDTGFMISDHDTGWWYESNSIERTLWVKRETLWSDVDGSILSQADDSGRWTTEPWRWGKRDQTGPTLPAWLREWATRETALRQRREERREGDSKGSP